MSGDSISLGWPLAALLAILAAGAAVTVQTAGFGSWRTPVRAAVRCVGQLAAVSSVIGFVLQSLWSTCFFIGFMTIVAAATASRRITRSRGLPAARASVWMLLPVAGAVGPTMTLALLTGVVPLAPTAVLPASGILVGGAMTAATLAGLRVIDDLTSQHGTYEAALALGFTRRQSVGIVARGSAALALVPGQDQARTVGLVTLPGAFVGVLLTGASPIEAGAAQAFILISLLAVQAVAAAITVELIATARVTPRVLVLKN